MLNAFVEQALCPVVGCNWLGNKRRYSLLISYRQVLIGESLENVPAARLMQTGFVVVPPDLPVDRLVEDYLTHAIALIEVAPQDKV